jgi:AraC-like DNA-binding protein
MIPPGVGLHEDLEPGGGGLARAEVSFLVHPAVGSDDPLVRLRHPRAVPVRDPASVRGDLDHLSRCCIGWRPRNAAAALAARPILDALLQRHLHDRLSAGAFAPAHATCVPAWLDGLLGWIGENVRNPDLDLAALARQAGFSPSHLGHAFHRHLRQTPMTVVRQARLRMAARLLRDATQHSIATIAARCGYANPTMLSRHFRAAYGCTPQAWRQGGGNG